MALTRTSSIRLLRIGIFALIAVVIIGYAISRAGNYAKGPHITILEPANGSTMASTTVLIKGRIDRLNKITMNGLPISIDETGNWSESIILFPGLNDVSFAGEDLFGRTTQADLILVGTQAF